jgi:hypothetical protein
MVNKKNNKDINKQIVIYKPKDSKDALEVRLESETVWLNQYQMAELLYSSRVNITEHISNIYSEGELKKTSTCRNF